MEKRYKEDQPSSLYLKFLYELLKEGVLMKRKKLNISPYLFILPHLIFFAVFFAVPFFTGIITSFCRWDLYTKPEFIGFENYKTILFDQERIYYAEFWNGIKNTFKYVMYSVPPLIIVPLLLAAGLNLKYRGNKVHQAIFYFPSLLSVATVVLTWKWLLDRQYGLINNALGLDVPWTVNQPYVWISIVALSVWWGIGSNMIIYQSGLSSISRELYESADIDGANSVQKFTKITLPSLKQTLLFTLVMTTIASFNIYGQPLMLTGGGPSKSVKVLMMVIQETVFGSSMPQAGIGSAMAVMLGICIITVSIFQFRLSNNEGN
jgi:multiple sugar transport system permease protein